MSIRLLIVGAGLMGEDHASIVSKEIPGVTLQVICDTDELRAKSVADKYGAKDISTNPESAVSRDDIDAVIVASPDFTHTPLALACIAANKKVLCEKPLSQLSSECLEVINAEQKKDFQFVQLGFMRRYDQSYIELKAALEKGVIGSALMMHNFHRNVETPSTNFTASMAITNSAPHEFDVVRYILKTEYKNISAFQPKRTDAHVAPVVMVLETVSHQIITIEINVNASYGYDVRAELVGEAGSISLNNVAYSRTDIKLASSTSYSMDWRDRYCEAYVRQNRAFIDFVLTDNFSEKASNCWDGYCATLVAETGVVALKSGQKQVIKMINKPELYL